MKKCWDYVKYPDRIKNMPRYTMFMETDEGYFQIIPDWFSLREDMLDKIVPSYDDVIDDKMYRGLCVHFSDHGNVTLYFKYKNGNTKEIWGLV